MRVLYIDIDTLRPDHLGCYGYHRNTSPNIDRIAAEGVRFENCYVTDAPCLPARASLWTGRFGIHTGVVGHGGTAADLRLEGESRGFRTNNARLPWMAALRNAGVYTASVSTFAERHSAFWFYQGFNEMYNQGGGGLENADEVEPFILNWLEKNADRDNWFFHAHTWDPHTPYSTPEEYGNPFEDEPPADWLTEQMIKEHRESYGPHSARELQCWDDVAEWPRVPGDISSLADFKKWIDGYDVGIRYADDQIGKILDLLEAKGVLDDTAIIISSDHGENQGELNIYGDHATADHITSRVPLIIRWPGVTTPRVDRAFHYQTDLAPTVSELLGAQPSAEWDGVSFAKSLRDQTEEGRDYLVVSQCAWSCQRSVRFGPWMLIRTYHDGLKNFPEFMLFNVEEDPHETNNLADEKPDIVNEGLALLEKWHTEMMATADSDADPLWTVMQEGGPHHTRHEVERVCKRLRETNRAHHADDIETRYAAKKYVKESS